jgi:hypothetical protein
MSELPLEPLSCEQELMDEMDNEEVVDLPKKKKHNHRKPCKKGKCCLHDVYAREIHKTRELVKGPKSPWGLFVMERRQEHESSVAANKRLSLEWKQLSKEEKEHYQHLAKNDRNRFEGDLRKLNVDDKKLYKKFVHQKRQRLRRVPQLSGYTLFVKENRKQIANQNPTFGFTEIGKELGIQWKILSDDKRQEYKDKAIQIKEEAKNRDVEEDESD